jgi:hypothetical protein
MPAKSIPVSDTQLSDILRGAAPLRRQDRDAYLALVAEQLGRGQGPFGDGDVFRATRLAQHSFFDPPHLETHAGISKIRSLKGARRWPFGRAPSLCRSVSGSRCKCWRRRAMKPTRRGCASGAPRALYEGMSGFERVAVLLQILGAATRVTLAECDIAVVS